MKRWIPLVFGVLLALAGVLWTLQGLDLMGQSGGMNGNRLWAVVGPVVAVVGLALVVIGVRAGRTTTDRTTTDRTTRR